MKHDMDDTNKGFLGHSLVLDKDVQSSALKGIKYELTKKVL